MALISLKSTPTRALMRATLPSTVLRPVAAVRGGTYQWIPFFARAIIITFKLRGTRVQARATKNIQRSGSVRTETRQCDKRAGTRQAVLLKVQDHGTSPPQVLRTWGNPFQEMASALQ